MEKCKQPIFDKSWVNTEGQAAQLSHGTWYNVVNEDSNQLDNQYSGRFGNGNFDMEMGNGLKNGIFHLFCEPPTNI